MPRRRRAWGDPDISYDSERLTRAGIQSTADTADAATTAIVDTGRTWSPPIHRQSTANLPPVLQGSELEGVGSACPACPLLLGIIAEWKRRRLTIHVIVPCNL